MIRGRKIWGALGGVALAMVVLGACSNKLDTAKGEAEIKKDLQDPAIGLTVTAVSCPSDVALQKDATFTCKVTVANGDTVDVKVIQKDDQGNVTIDYKNSLLVPDMAKIKSALSKATDINCPAAVALTNGKGALVCTATDDTGTKVKITIPISDGSLQGDQLTTAPA